MMNNLVVLKNAVMAKCGKFMNLKKEHGGKEVIAEIALAVLVVALVIIFRGQMVTLITDLTTNMTTKITGLFS